MLQKNKCILSKYVKENKPRTSQITRGVSWLSWKTILFRSVNPTFLINSKITFLSTQKRFLVKTDNHFNIDNNGFLSVQHQGLIKEAFIVLLEWITGNWRLIWYFISLRFATTLQETVYFVLPSDFFYIILYMTFILNRILMNSVSLKGIKM